MGQRHGQGRGTLLAIDDLGRFVAPGLRQEDDRPDEWIAPEGQVRPIHEGHEVVDEEALYLCLAPAIRTLV